jgi:hypothetical protein
MSKKYVALSYCWGPPVLPAFTTSASTFEDRKRKIPMAALPMTIRDAATLTRQLGIRYLWVDAICILQGSDKEAREDWERECSRMKDVYGGAYLTISAAAGPSAHSGIFSKRVASSPPHVKLEIELPDSPGSHGHIFIGFKQEYEDSLSQPLYTRGWTLQERILSPRVLVCNSDQFAWECQSSRLTESGMSMKKAGVVRLTKQIFQSPSALSDFWHNTVRDFAARALTVPADKLPAMSGLASALHHVTGDEYLAGLWRSTFYADLLWMRGDPIRKDALGRSRPSTFRAPSWSWASLDGDVRYIPRSKLRRSEEFHAELLDVKVTPAGIDPFGEVSGGIATLRGPLKHVDMVYLNQDNEGVELRASLPNNQGGLHVGDAWMDGELGQAEHGGVWVLRISQDMALVLTAVESDMVQRFFTRLGMVALNMNGIEWFSVCEMESIMIR